MNNKINKIKIKLFFKTFLLNFSRKLHDKISNEYNIIVITLFGILMNFIKSIKNLNNSKEL